MLKVFALFGWLGLGILTAVSAFHPAFLALAGLQLLAYAITRAV